MKIENIIIIIFGIAAIILLLWYIFGQSPTLEQVILVLVGFILTILVFNVGLTFKIWGELQRHLGEHGGSGKS